MASSSSSASASPSKWTYDVFLSFRGVDTRKNFVNHLYKALKNKGIFAYKDDKNLERGESIGPALVKAINTSRYAIVIFSKNYSSSSWCLDELVHIIDRMRNKSQIVLPVFYDVDPADVRKQKGRFGEAFAKHQTERVSVWRDALFEASNLAGWEPKNVANGHEAQCIDEIVERISLQLHEMYPTADKNLIGMESRMQDVKSSLEIGGDGVCMIGIWGMGGAGKTTLARAIFDEISTHFESAVFAENVRDISNKYGLQHVQKRLLCVVDKNLEVESVSDGIQLLRKRLCMRKILIVLDDVDQVDQLQSLAGDPNWFGQGSRIIITTRDEQVLRAHQVNEIHNVSLLNKEEALELFCKYAFHNNHPMKGYEEPSEEVVSYASGLPLTIKVLGSFLCGKALPDWRSALAKLQEVPEDKTLRNLEIGFHSLDDIQKEMFLDIACFYRGMETDLILMMLDSCGYFATSDLRVLQQRCLVFFSDENRCEVHDLIEEMAMHIVRKEHPDEPWKHSRLRRPQEVLDVLKNNKGTQKTKAMVVSMIGQRDYDHVNLDKAFRNMHSLRLLHVSYTSRITFSGPNYLPEELRFLHFEDYPQEYLPESYEGKNLVKLKLTGKHIRGLWEEKISILTLWKGRNTKVFKNLKFLTIEFSDNLKITPDFTSMPNLEGVVFRLCRNLAEVHSSLGDLKRLKSLEVSWQKTPIKLPLTIGNLDSLLELKMNRLTTKLPMSIGCLGNLVLLDLQYCSCLVTLPNSISELKCLATLNLKNCGDLRELPPNLGSGGNLACLETLNLERCISLFFLPPNIGHLPRLKSLILVGSGLKKLPDSICFLCSWKTVLDLEDLDRLECLPDTLGGMQNLEKLVLRHCNTIEHLPDSLCQITCLKTLEISFCWHLEDLPQDLGNIECLEELHISVCRIEHLPDSICRLKRLRALQIEFCNALNKLPENLGDMKCLETLSLTFCALVDLPDSICRLKCLKTIYILDCPNLQVEKILECPHLRNCLAPR